jgi:hypothetical protein
MEKTLPLFEGCGGEGGAERTGGGRKARIEEPQRAQGEMRFEFPEDALEPSHPAPSDSPARASTTDAEARVMKMGDGGFRPAFNMQHAVAGSELGGPRTIVGVNVTNVGSDMGSPAPPTAGGAPAVRAPGFLPDRWTPLQRSG